MTRTPANSTMDATTITTNNATTTPPTPTPQSKSTPPSPCSVPPPFDAHDPQACPLCTLLTHHAPRQQPPTQSLLSFISLWESTLHTQTTPPFLPTNHAACFFSRLAGALRFRMLIYRGISDASSYEAMKRAALECWAGYEEFSRQLDAVRGHEEVGGAEGMEGEQRVGEASDPGGVPVELLGKPKALDQWHKRKLWDVE